MSHHHLHDLVVHSQNLARYHRNHQAIAALQSALTAPDLPDEGRHLLLRQLVRLQVEVPSEREAARETIEALESFDTALAKMESAWLAYYGSRATEGFALMASYLNDHAGASSPRMALLLGKLHTDHGFHETARDWLLLSLDLARHQADYDHMAATFGALAEVFYRSGVLDVAHELVELDADLLPPGSFHVERLRVYRAHLYRQYRQLDAARSQYHEALQAACLRGSGQAYPLRGLLWCDLLEVQQGEGRVQSMLESLAELRTYQEPHSLAHGLLAVSRALHIYGRAEESLDCLREGHRLFDQEGFPFEAAWCAAALSGDLAPPHLDKEIASIPCRPFTLSASDRWLADVPLKALADRWRSAREAFDSDSAEDQLTWMGLFF